MRKGLLVLAAVTLLTGVLASTAAASHSWSNYHWARTANPFTIKVIDSMTADWDLRLDKAIADWDTPTATSGAKDVLNPVEEAGDDSTKTRKQCRAVQGKVKSCNANYGFNGWLGLASISVSGSHITQAIAKMNDSYLSSSSYNDVNKQHVVCQEIGHGWGLGHQDESGKDLNTCMDYADALDNPSPNDHDYQQLEIIYGGHNDSSTTVAAVAPGLAGNEHAQPERVERNDRIASSVVTEHFADGTRRITHIFWAIPS